MAVIDLKKVKLATRTEDLKEDSFIATVSDIKVTQGVEEEHPDWGDRMRVHLGLKAPWNNLEDKEDVTWVNLNYSKRNPETGEYGQPSEKSQYGHFIKCLNREAGCKIDEITDLVGQRFRFVRREVELMKGGKPSRMILPVEWLEDEEKVAADAQEIFEEGEEAVPAAPAPSPKPRKMK